LSDISETLAAGLKSVAEANRYRVRRILTSPQSVKVIVGDKPVINFCSNDYLGLANHPAVLAAFKQGAEDYGVGSGSAHLICGHSRAHHALEEELAEFTGRDRALLFATGYMANIGTINALAGSKDWVFEDRLNHASLLDGGLSSGAKFKRYGHADTRHLQRLLEQSAGHKLIVTDGVFSMDGDFAPLPELAALALEQAAWLMVDDAHGLGVMGERGGGLLEHFGLNQTDVPVLMGTLGKAFGSFGAFVAGSEALVETLIQSARTYIYTTALPAAIAEATRASLQIVINETWRRDKLNHLVAHFKQGAGQLGLPLMPSSSAIQPILIGESQEAVRLSNALWEAGFWVGAIRPPTVPKGSARLRVTFSAWHDQEQLDRLLETLALRIRP